MATFNNYVKLPEGISQQKLASVGVAISGVRQGVAIEPGTQTLSWALAACRLFRGNSWVWFLRGEDEIPRLCKWMQMVQVKTDWWLHHREKNRSPKSFWHGSSKICYLSSPNISRLPKYKRSSWWLRPSRVERQTGNLPRSINYTSIR